MNKTITTVSLCVFIMLSLIMITSIVHLKKEKDELTHRLDVLSEISKKSLDMAENCLKKCQKE